MKLDIYYIDLYECLGEDFSHYEFDDQGIPLSRYYRIPKWRHNPITVCQYGLHHFNKYLKKGSLTSKEIFLNQAEWLVANARESVNNSVVWFYLFDLPYYAIKAPWISGMAQCQAISVLLRAHQLTSKAKYLSLAQKAWNILKVEVSKGGVFSHFPDGLPLIEEYPSKSQPSCVLNGFVFALFGIYDYYSYLNSEQGKELFNQLIYSLKNNIYRYDSGFWSYYDIFFPLRLASKDYHKLHIDQLEKLYKLTKEKIFLEYSVRWERYRISIKSNIKWIIKKVHQKLILKV